MAAQLFPGTALTVERCVELSSDGCIKETKVYGFVKKYTFAAMVFSALWLFSAAALFTRVFSLSDAVYCAVPFYVFGTAVFIMTAYLSYFGDFIIPALYSLISSALVAAYGICGAGHDAWIICTYDIVRFCRLGTADIFPRGEEKSA